MRKFLKPEPEAPPGSAVITVQEVADHPHEPAAPAEPVAAAGVLSALLDFVLPAKAQHQGATMGRNARHDLVCVAEHLVEAKNRLKSVATDASAAGEFIAANFLNSLIERLA
jgi:hypothetical protein